MIQINQCKLPIDHTKQELEAKIRKTLSLKKDETFTYQIRKKSIDARKKPDLYYVYQIWVSLAKENAVIKRVHHPAVMIADQKTYQPPLPGEHKICHPPVVVGAGPAGLFAAYLLTEAGYAPVVIERGKPVEERKKDVEAFWETGILDPSSNVQFGEGGAGTFSDGKLNTAVKDPSRRNQFVLETFVKYGAPEHILSDPKPHIGTDILSQVIHNMRESLKKKGCRFLFQTCVTDFVIEQGRLRQICCDNGTALETEAVILAIGHSSRDTFRMLERRRIPMEAKNFAVGFRVEHPQKMINTYAYGDVERNTLPAAPYKVTSNFPNGRGVYSFCMCPGGYVVNSSSEPERLVVNGMSYSGRTGKNANSAIIVSVGTGDFGGSDALAGMRYQMELEHNSYLLGEGRIPQQLFGDYSRNIPSHAYGEFESQTKGDAVFANLRGLLSEEMEQSFLQGMAHFSKIIPGFDRADAILSGIESRTSSPVRIVRGERMESDIEGLYPCGEGAGYAGGIMSAAIDGIKVAEAIIRRYKP